MKHAMEPWRHISGKYIVLSFLVTVFVLAGTPGQTEESTKQLNDLAQSMCDGDLDCIRELSDSMRDVQQQMSDQLQSPMASFSQPGYQTPCRIVVPPYSCIPVSVAVENHYVEQSRGFIHSGVLPDDPEEYVSNFVEFHYTATALGELIHNEDYSRFQAVVIGIPEATRVFAFHGYTQSLDQNDRLHRRNYRTDGARVRRAFDFGFHYPDDEFPPATAWTNMMLTPAEVETRDDWLPTFGGSRINGGDEGVGPRFYITPEVLQTIIADGGFEKHYKWRDTQPGGNHWADNNLTVRVALKPSCDPNLAVKIIRPKTATTDYGFSEATPGKLKMTLRAKVTPAKYSKQIEWEVPQLAGSARKLTPQDGKGPNVKVIYTGLPKNNTAFGEKEVIARVKVKGCTAKAKTKVRLFFPRDARNNPDGKVPNWFYYWSQTKAHAGKAKYGGTGGRCSAAKGTGVDAGYGYHQHEKFSDYYYICELGAHGKEFPFKEAVQWPKGGNPSMISTKGIDTFAVVSRHENLHLDLTLWWNKHRTTDPKILNSDDLNHNRVPDTLEAKLDTDMDRVPNSMETSYGLNPNKKYTYPPPIKQNDEELLAWKKELESWNIGQGKTEDWACPGSNATSCP